MLSRSLLQLPLFHLPGPGTRFGSLSRCCLPRSFWSSHEPDGLSATRSPTAGLFAVEHDSFPGQPDCSRQSSVLDRETRQPSPAWEPPHERNSWPSGDHVGGFFLVRCPAMPGIVLAKSTQSPAETTGEDGRLPTAPCDTSRLRTALATSKQSTGARPTQRRSESSPLTVSINPKVDAHAATAMQDCWRAVQLWQVASWARIARESRRCGEQRRDMAGGLGSAMGT